MYKNKHLIHKTLTLSQHQAGAVCVCLTFLDEIWVEKLENRRGQS